MECCYLRFFFSLMSSYVILLLPSNLWSYHNGLWELNPPINNIALGSLGRELRKIKTDYSISLFTYFHPTESIHKHYYKLI